MKILFLVYHGFNKSSGISKKIMAQVKGLRQNGHDVSLCYYDFGEDGHRCRFVDGKVIRDFGTWRYAGYIQRMCYGEIYDFCRDNGVEMVYARSFHNANPWLIHLFCRLRRLGVRCVTEIPTYPYDREYDDMPLFMKAGFYVDKMFRRSLAARMDAMVTFSDAEEIFGKRTIRISNGVDFDSIKLHDWRRAKASAGSTVNMIAVAEVHPWHGFDRIIAGLGEYHGKRDVRLHIVGGVEKWMMEGNETFEGFAPMVERYGIGDKVVFYGQLFGDELDRVFDQCCVAIGSLARHRSGISNIKTLKNREYASRGLPFIYSENDSDFEGQPYVMRVPADETPIRIEDVLEFVDNVRVSSAEIRESVAHLSWKRQMQKVVEDINE